MASKAIFPDLSKPVVMGILNLTPDSFYDGGRWPENYLERAGTMLEEGASIIDVGGASTRPGARELSPEEEWERIERPLADIRNAYPDCCISVDTYHAFVAERAIAGGADMINDISGGTFDAYMPSVIGSFRVPYVIMHIQGRPGNMQTDPRYDDVVGEVYSYFEERIRVLRAAGAGTLVLDPGFGFGKTVEHNYLLLQQLHRFRELGYPLLAGLSRKSMINRVLNIPPHDAMNGTTVLNTIALLHGASILRVHDVKQAREAVKLVEMLNKGSND